MRESTRIVSPEPEQKVKTENIECFIPNLEVVERILSIEDLEKRIQSGCQINIMMGQTFDGGQPMDMLKYGLFMMNLSDYLKEKGVSSSRNWLLADHFITDINKDSESEIVEKQMDDRVSFLQRIDKVYGGSTGIIFSSQLSQLSKYKNNLNILLEETKKNENFRDKVLEAVPKDRRSNPNAFIYPLEELATIQTIGADIKVGPPYEICYDQPARGIAETIGFNKYVAIHLKNSYPFGNPQIATELLREIEEYGILPYKINSKGLGNFRVDVFDPIEKSQELIYSTTDIRALLDLIKIANIAKGCLKEEGVVVERNELSKLLETGSNNKIDQLQNEAFELYKTYIYQPMNSGN